MLTRLVIRDFAIIEHLEVEFESGFVVVTGETGAGKSILVNALHLILGGRASDDMIRTDAESAEVEGVFQLAEHSPVLGRLAELGLQAGSALVVRRRISRSDRNRVFVNDRTVNLNTLAGLTRSLVDISGQHEHVGLTDEEVHLEILDGFGELGELRNRVSAAVERLRTAERDLEALSRQEHQRAERQDYLAFTLGRIDSVDPVPGEDDELERERLRLSNVERLREGLGQALGGLYSRDGSAVELVGKASKQVSGLVKFDPDLQPLADQLDAQVRVVEELARDLETALGGLSGDPARLEGVEQRLHALRGLVKSHGPSLDAVLETRGRMREELESLAGIESRRAELQKERQTALEAAFGIASSLSAKRQAVAERLSGRLQTELTSLAMDGARFQVEVSAGTEGDLDSTGIDRVRFLFSANPGEAVRPLVRVASGGELSRVLLALKAVLAEVDPVSTYVFDEVDSGVGGAVAEVLGDKLAQVATVHQVICITHLPQIAAHGKSHFSVLKRMMEGRTVSGVRRLSGRRERVEEIARMVGGRSVTEKARSHARDLLDRAGLPEG